MLTGFKHQYCIQRDGKGGGRWVATAKFNPRTKKFADHANNPQEGWQSVWVVPWPEVDGTGDRKPLTQHQLFARMCAWDDENYLLAASTKGTSDRNTTNGLIDNHAYSILECANNVAGTGVHMIQVRNPWGGARGGMIEKGMFNTTGAGWKKYPQIKKALNPLFADDGVFWLTMEEFFKHYETIWLSGVSMTKFFKHKK